MSLHPLTIADVAQSHQTWGGGEIDYSKPCVQWLPLQRSTSKVLHNYKQLVAFEDQQINDLSGWLLFGNNSRVVD